jgi:hypothetical protein
MRQISMHFGNNQTPTKMGGGGHRGSRRKRPEPPHTHENGGGSEGAEKPLRAPRSKKKLPIENTQKTIRKFKKIARLIATRKAGAAIRRNVLEVGLHDMPEDPTPSPRRPPRNHCNTKKKLWAQTPGNIIVSPRVLKGKITNGKSQLAPVAHRAVRAWGKLPFVKKHYILNAFTRYPDTVRNQSNTGNSKCVQVACIGK